MALSLFRIPIQRAEAGVLKIISGATCTLYKTMSNGSAPVTAAGVVTEGAVLLPIFTDRTGLVAASNPIISDAQGYISAFVKTSEIHILVVASDGSRFGLSWEPHIGVEDVIVNALSYPTIQAAHDALPATGGVLHIPAGTYTPSTVPAYTGLIISKDNVKVKGDPYMATILKVTTTEKNNHLIDITAASPGIADGVSLEDLVLWGPEVEADNEELGIGIRLHKDAIQNFRARNVVVFGTGSWALSFKTVSDPGSFQGEFHLENVACYSAKSGGSMRLGGAGLNAMLFTKCQFNGPPFGTYGAGGLSRGSVHLDWCYSVKFDRCSFQDNSCGTAVSFTRNCYNVSFDTCHFETNQIGGDLGGHWITSASGGTNNHHVTWKNCTFLRRNSANRGIMLLKTHTDTNIYGWVFEDCRMQFDKTADNATDDIVLGAGGTGLSMIRCERLWTLADIPQPEQSWTISGAGAQRVEFIEKPKVAFADTFATPYTPNAKFAETIELTLTGNITINAPTLPQKGLRLTFVFIQDGTGGRTVTWNAIFKTNWSNSGNTANLQSTITFYYNGTNWVQVGAQSVYV